MVSGSIGRVKTKECINPGEGSKHTVRRGKSLMGTGLGCIGRGRDGAENVVGPDGVVT